MNPDKTPVGGIVEVEGKRYYRLAEGEQNKYGDGHISMGATEYEFFPWWDSLEEFNDDESCTSAVRSIAEFRPVVELQYDAVKKPEHYNTGDIECIDAIKACLGPDFAGYLHGNAMKYLWRHEYKGNPKQDLEKAIWYISKLKEQYED